jgi:hypothetical protein
MPPSAGALSVGRRAFSAAPGYRLQDTAHHGVAPDVAGIAALHTNIADLLDAAGRQDEAVGQLKEAARRFAAVDAGDGPRPEIWTLVEW